jgi:hypothetical protein
MVFVIRANDRRVSLRRAAEWAWQPSPTSGRHLSGRHGKDGPLRSRRLPKTIRARVFRDFSSCGATRLRANNRWHAAFPTYGFCGTPETVFRLRSGARGSLCHAEGFVRRWRRGAGTLRTRTTCWRAWAEGRGTLRAAETWSRFVLPRFSRIVPNAQHPVLNKLAVRLGGTMLAETADVISLNVGHRTSWALFWPAVSRICAASRRVCPNFETCSRGITQFSGRI